MDAAQVVDGLPQRDEGKVPGQREVCRVLEDVHTLTGPLKRDEVLTVRRVLVHSTANDAGQQAARAQVVAGKRRVSACLRRHVDADATEGPT